MHCDASNVLRYMKRVDQYLRVYAPQVKTQFLPADTNFCYSILINAHTPMYLPEDTQFHQQSSKSKGEFILIVPAGVIHLDIQYWRQLTLPNLKNSIYTMIINHIIVP